jgi:1L-myo-inositol 1-phosphate cytidylyltransferase
MMPIAQAIVLLAGEGSRLRSADRTVLKPFVPVLGRPLISYTIDALVRAGIQKFWFVVGYESKRVIAETRRLMNASLDASFIENRHWQKQNGISLLAAAHCVATPFLLTMGDHVFDEAVIRLLLDLAQPDLLNIAIDRKLDSIFDLQDAMKVQTRKGQVTAIGKHLTDYDAIDTGLFVCPREIFSYLEEARSRDAGGDCSLADGIRLMAGSGKVRAIDIGDSWWQDVDTPQMLFHAEEKLQGLNYSPKPG